MFKKIIHGRGKGTIYSVCQYPCVYCRVGPAAAARNSGYTRYVGLIVGTSRPAVSSGYGRRRPGPTTGAKSRNAPSPSRSMYMV